MGVNTEVMESAAGAAFAASGRGVDADVGAGRFASVLHRSLTWDFLVAVKLMTFALIIAIRPFGITHDCGLLLHAAEQMVDGGVPYVDFLEQNPPLIYYLLAVPVGIARAIGVNAIPAYLVMFWMLVVGSTLAIRRLLTMAADTLSPMQRGLILFAIVVASECTLLAPDFGQREHWFAIAFVPLLVLRWLAFRQDPSDGPRAMPSVGFRILLGIGAGVGAALKHHFILIWLGIEFACVFRTRRWRVLIAPETIAASIVLIAYLAHFLFVPAEMRDGFFVRWAPFVMAHYWVYSHAIDLAHVLFVAGVTIVYGGAAIVAWRASAAELRHASLVMMFALLTLFGLASFVMQGKDYSYHLIPVYFGALPCMAIYASELVVRGSERQRSFARMCVVGVALGTIPAAIGELGLSATIGRAFDEPTPVWREILARSDSGDAILFVSTNVGDGYPELMRYGYRAGSRYLVSMPIALVHSDLRAAGDAAIYHDTSNRPDIEQQYLRELAADVRERTPRLVAVVDHTDCQGCAPGFNVHTFLDRAGVIDAALASYDDIGTYEGKLGPVRLYARRRAAAALPAGSDVADASESAGGE